MKKIRSGNNNCHEQTISVVRIKISKEPVIPISAMNCRSSYRQLMAKQSWQNSFWRQRPILL